MKAKNRLSKRAYPKRIVNRLKMYRRKGYTLNMIHEITDVAVPTIIKYTKDLQRV